MTTSRSKVNWKSKERPMPTAKITSKGQVTIPVKVRRVLGLRPGTLVDFRETAKGEFILRAKTGSVRDLRGCLAGFDLPRTDEEMNELIHRRAAELDAATKSDAQTGSDGEEV
jgi:AbrB family looped-hinge helix DNA binding protein